MIFVSQLKIPKQHPPPHPLLKTYSLFYFIYSPGYLGRALQKLGHNFLKIQKQSQKLPKNSVT